MSDNAETTPAPKVLNSLDCDQARDGTVWKSKTGVLQYTKEYWLWKGTDRHQWINGADPKVTSEGPYTEVIL